MDKAEVLRQCLEWNKKRKKVKPHPRYKQMRKEEIQFTKRNLEKLAKPRFEKLSIVSQTVHDEREYPIFFIEDRQIKEGEGVLTWAYSGSLFKINEEKVKYGTTTAFISEENIKPLEIF